MHNDIFINKRETFMWGSKGKHHNEEWRIIKLKDLSDSHLLHIIAWIEKYLKQYDNATLDIMKQEQRYRVDNYIFVPEYTEELWNEYIDKTFGYEEYNQ